MSTTDENVTTTHRYFDEVVNGGKIELLDDLMTPDYVMHGGSLGEHVGLEAYKAFFAAAANGGAFTGMHVEVLRVLAEEDVVFVHFTNSGTNSGEFMGRPATNTFAKWNGTALFRFTEDGRITESTYVEDVLDMINQLG
ncbi:ester cyclase [Streptosporangium sp. NPDC002721]|uniref:ester cyclase n=1 Tax=Streptosporangium sp. NPDC002721 TaxID=3366188 RepID=UPI003690F523